VLQLLVVQGGARLDVLCPHDLQSGRLSIARFILRARLHECYSLVLAEGGPGLMALHAQGLLATQQDPAGAALLGRLAAEQEERLAAVDALLAAGLPLGVDAAAFNVGGVRLDRLRDRRGRPLLRAAVEDSRPRQVLDSLAAGLRQLKLSGVGGGRAVEGASGGMSTLPL